MLEGLEATLTSGATEVIDGEKGSGDSIAWLRRVNDALMQAERALIDDRGLEWPNLVQASDLRAGFLYGICGVAVAGFAAGDRRWRATDASEAANRVTEFIKRATEVLKKGRE